MRVQNDMQFDSTTSVAPPRRGRKNCSTRWAFVGLRVRQTSETPLWLVPAVGWLRARMRMPRTLVSGLAAIYPPVGIMGAAPTTPRLALVPRPLVPVSVALVHLYVGLAVSVR